MRLRNINARVDCSEDDVAVVSGFSPSVHTGRELDMVFIHRTNRSEWDDAYRNIRVTANDVEFAVVILGIFTLIALTF